jgi:hypothetical protein
MRLSGREQVSHKTLSELVAELELYGFVEVERKGRGRGRGADFYISPTGSVERKVLLDTLKEYVAYTIDIICNVLPLLKCVSALFGAVGRST